MSIQNFKSTKVAAISSGAGVLNTSRPPEKGDAATPAGRFLAPLVRGNDWRDIVHSLITDGFLGTRGLELVKFTPEQKEAADTETLAIHKDLLSRADDNKNFKTFAFNYELLVLDDNGEPVKVKYTVSYAQLAAAYGATYLTASGKPRSSDFFANAGQRRMIAVLFANIIIEHYGLDAPQTEAVPASIAVYTSEAERMKANVKDNSNRGVDLDAYEAYRATCDYMNQLKGTENCPEFTMSWICAFIGQKGTGQKVNAALQLDKLHPLEGFKDAFYHGDLDVKKVDKDSHIFLNGGKKYKATVTEQAYNAETVRLYLEDKKAFEKSIGYNAAYTTFASAVTLVDTAHSPILKSHALAFVQS